MKNLSRLLRHEWLQLFLLALPFALAALWWNKFSDRVVTHWDLHNQPNGWMPKVPGLLLPPTLNVFLCALITLLPRIDPRLRRHGSNTTRGQRRAWRAFRLGFSGLLTVVSLVVLAAAVGWRPDVSRVCVCGALILLVIVGNFMSGLEPNYLMGIRTPWTLEDPATWRATHRLGGRIMVFGSLVALAAGFFVSCTVQLGLLAGFAVVLALWSLGYSAWFYRTHAAITR